MMSSREAVPDDIEDVVAVLEGCLAFAGASRAALAALAADCEVIRADPGERFAGAVATRPMVVLRGAFLVRDSRDRTVDLVGEREFHAGAPGQTIEAVGPVLALALGDPAIDVAWSAPLPSGAAAGAVIDEQTAPVRTIMSAPPVCAAGDESCREVAERMRRHRISSVIVQAGPERTGILTDRDLRDLVAAGGSVDVPVAAIASFPVLGVGASSPVFEALIEMLTRGIHHLAVTDRGQVVGVVSSTDLLALRNRSPLYLRGAIARAGDVDGVAAALAALPDTVGSLLAAGTAPTDVGRVVAAITDRVVARLLALAHAHLGDAPGPFAWMAFGSQGRQEQTLSSDQDTGLLIADGLGPAEREWFARLGRWMTDALERCGYGRCHGGVMASEPSWRDDVTGWRTRFKAWMTTPTEKHLLGAEIAFDLRSAGGDLDALRELGPTLRSAPSHPLFLGHLARIAVGHRPPLGFLGGLAVERSGEHAGTFDVKRGALLPIADLARLHALARGSIEVGTDERLAATADAGELSADLADTLRSGYALALRLRLEHQLRRLADGAAPDTHIDPHDLPPLVRSQLREVFKATRRAQEIAAEVFHSA